MQNLIDETCLLTPAIQRRLKEKRLQLGLTYRLLGDYFHVSWSTFQKWECAPAPARCQKHFRNLLNSYLAGEHDEALKTYQDPVEELIEKWRRLPPLVHQCMERITTTYDLCQGRPDLRQALVQALDNAAQNALQRLFS